MSINVQVFNCSPNEANGYTEKILNPLLEGMKKAGASIDKYYTHRMNIEKCRACTEDVSFQSPGECNIVDDMKYIYPKLRESELWVFASPNYPKGINSSLIKLLDRLEPLFEPFANQTNGTKLPVKNKFKGKILLVSTCSQFEFGSFKSLIEHIESFSLLFGREFAGSILRPHSWTLNTGELLSSSINILNSSLNNAGAELIETGRIKEETVKSVNKNLISKKSFLASLSAEIV